jgi:hypothetical protein
MATKLYRVWMILVLVLFLWTTFMFIRPWTTYIVAIQNRVSSITFMPGATRIEHTQIAQSELTVTYVTDSTRIAKKWSASELQIHIALGALVSLLVVFFSIGLLRQYSNRNIVGFVLSAVGWYIIIAIGYNTLLPPVGQPFAIGWLLCAIITVVFTFVGHKKQMI